MPVISVIVPVFNTEKYLEKCIRSILAQSLKDIEIICVDDCSPDGSLAIVDRLASEDDRVRIIRHERNLGLGAARNTAIRAAKSEYLASVDSDDFIDPDMLQAMWEGTQGGYFDVVVCGYEDVDEEGRVLGEHQTRVTRLDPIPEDQNPFEISNPAFWNKLWRRSLFVDNDIYFPERIYYQDSATTPRIYKKANNINFIGGTHYKYLIRRDSVSNSVSDKHILDKLRELSVVKDFLLKEGIYALHYDDFQDRAINSYRYHTQNVINNNKQGDAGTDEYLRFLLIMREAFLSFDDEVRMLSTEQKAKALWSGTRLPGSAGASSVSGAAVQAHQPSAVPRRLPEAPRLLVLTLFSGENEIERSRTSLADQDYNRWDHRVFEWMGNVEGHRTLYTTIMDKSDEYDMFLKLDADMVFARPDVLSRIVQIFKESADLDHLIVACDDFMTGRQIMGVHAFSHRVAWEFGPEGLFLDPSPKRPGRRRLIERPMPSLFLHSPDPSLFQAFHFGAHRALKLTQPGRSAQEKRGEAIKSQWEALVGVWSQFETLMDRRHALALVAADMVIQEEIGHGAHDYSDPTLRAGFDRVSKLSDQELANRLTGHWGTEEARKSYFERALGPSGLETFIRHLRETKQRGRPSKRWSAPGTASEAEAEALAMAAATQKSFRELYNGGRRLLKERAYNEAWEQMHHALRLKPESKLARIGAAEALLGMGRREEAVASYGNLSKEYPADPKLKARHEAVLGNSSIAPRIPDPL